MLAKKARRGGKVNQSHSSSTEAADVVVRAAELDPGTTKIHLGEIKFKGGSGLFSIKLVPATGGWHVKVTSSSSVQKLTIYTGDPQATKQALISAFTDAYEHAIVKGDDDA